MYSGGENLKVHNSSPPRISANVVANGKKKSSVAELVKIFESIADDDNYGTRTSED